MSDISQDEELRARLQDPAKRMELWQRMNSTATFNPFTPSGMFLARSRCTLPLMGWLKVLTSRNHPPADFSQFAFPQCGGHLSRHFSHLNT